MQLSHDNIERIIKDCMYRNDELPPNPTKDNLPEGAVISEGVMATFVFHPQRLEANRDMVHHMLSQLHDSFMAKGGGGQSLMQMPFDKNGVQYGEQRTADLLFVLGNALGYAKWVLPRHMWGALPGSMPYIVIDLTEPEKLT